MFFCCLVGRFVSCVDLFVCFVCLFVLCLLVPFAGISPCFPNMYMAAPCLLEPFWCCFEANPKRHQRCRARHLFLSRNCRSSAKQADQQMGLAWLLGGDPFSGNPALVVWAEARILWRQHRKPPLARQTTKPSIQTTSWKEADFLGLI